jgi:hypothetical protein
METPRVPGLRHMSKERSYEHSNNCDADARRDDRRYARMPQESEILAKGISDSTLSLSPGAGHFSMLESPVAFNRILMRFLDGLPRS